MREKLIQFVLESHHETLLPEMVMTINAIENLRCDQCKHYVKQATGCYNPESPVYYAEAEIQPDFFCAKWEPK